LNKDETDREASPLKSLLRQISSASQQSLNQPTKEEEYQEDDTEKPKIEAEKNIIGSVGFSVYKNYYLLGGNCFTLMCVVALFVLAQFAASAADMWVAFWTVTEQTRYSADHYINDTIDDQMKKGIIYIAT